MLNSIEKSPIKFPSKLIIGNENILFFDMDGTLIETDLANFLAYKTAIKSIIKKNFKLDYITTKRFNRENLKKLLPGLSNIEYGKIIKEKEKQYIKYLHKTITNTPVIEILKRYSQTNKTVLVTNSREERAKATLQHHNLIENFNHLFFRQSPIKKTKINKYKSAINKLNICAKDVIVFENENKEVEDALNAGIYSNNIIKLN